MGMAVAALGAIAGGMAGGALMKAMNGPPAGPDTSVPGISSATIKKGGKGQADTKVPQVDATQALDWMKQAAQAQESSYMSGLTYYNKSLMEAGQQMTSGFDQANQTLTPLSLSANAALNEQMKMMGLDPIPLTKGLGKLIEPYSQDIASKMDQADLIQDPAARAEAKQQIIQGLDSLQKTIEPLGARPESYTAKEFKPGGMNTIGNGIPTGMPGSDRNNWNLAEQKKVDEAANAQKVWDEKAASYGLQAGQQMAQNQQLNDIKNQFQNGYTDQYQKGYTGSQIADRIAATPGYQFQMDQGTKAIERQGAAAGMLGSGNTLVGLTQYGQNLAQNYYGMYMNNLANIVAEGSGATGQIATNQVNKNQVVGGLLQAAGQAGMSTYGAIGDAKANSLYNQAQLYNNVAQFNASMQLQGIEDYNNMQNQAANRQSQAQIAQMGILPAMQAQNLNQQKFNYSVFQNQQAGYQAASMANPGSTYSMGGVTYPNYTGIKV